jgi:hypothetical protein
MSRGPATFRQSDLARALRAARAAGLEIARVEVDRTGKITVIPGKPDSGDQEQEGSNDWADAK